jgi:uncharacterized protein YukE
MADFSTFQKTDAGMKGLHNALDSQITTMNTIAGQVEDAVASVGAHFVAESSTAYQGKVTNWSEFYAQVKSHATTILSNLDQSNQILDQGGDDATSTAQGWSPGSDVYFQSLS